MKRVAGEPTLISADRPRLPAPPGRTAPATALVPASAVPVGPAGGTASLGRPRIPAAFLTQLALQGDGRSEVAAERRDRSQRAAEAYAPSRGRPKPCGLIQDELV